MYFNYVVQIIKHIYASVYDAAAWAIFKPLDASIANPNFGHSVAVYGVCEQLDFIVGLSEQYDLL